MQPTCRRRKRAFDEIQTMSGSGDPAPPCGEDSAHESDRGTHDRGPPKPLGRTPLQQTASCACARQDQFLQDSFRNRKLWGAGPVPEQIKRPRQLAGTEGVLLYTHHVTDILNSLTLALKRGACCGPYGIQPPQSGIARHPGRGRRYILFMSACIL
jgi:hypothetical protein